MDKRIIVITGVMLLAASLACNIAGANTPTPYVTVTPTVTPTAGEPASPDADDEPTNSPTAEPTASPDATDDTPEPTAETPAPTEAAETEPPSTDPAEPLEYGDVLYQASLTSWQNVIVGSGENPAGSGVATAAGYEMRVRENWGHWVYSARVDAGDLYAEITAAPQECPAGSGNYGLLFHHEDGENFRAFAITCSGEYWLRQQRGPNNTSLARGALPDGIDATTGSHVLAVRAVDGVITMYVDGEQVDEVAVDWEPSGDVGPYVKTFDDPMVVIFNDILVAQPR